MFSSRRPGRSVPLAHSANAHGAPTLADSAPGLLPVLKHLADEARAHGNAHQAVLRVALDDGWSRVLSALSLSEKYAAWKVSDGATDAIDAPVGPLPRPLRLTSDELLGHPAGGAQALAVRNRPPMRGWLAVPLYDRHGRNFGMIELTDKDEGDFSADDEVRLVKFATIASLAIENACLFHSAHDAQTCTQQSPHRPSSKAETILLAEDDELVRTLAGHFLDLSGYHVLEASDGEVAMALAEHYAGPIHMLVADVVMPRVGGQLLADRLLSLHPHVKVLFISGYTIDVTHRHGVVDSDVAFLQKPFTTSALAQKIRDMLDAPV